MRVTATPLDEEMLAAVREQAQEAAVALGLPQTDRSTTAEQIVAAIDARVVALQKVEEPSQPLDNAAAATVDVDELALTLGSLWGEQLVRELNWHWSTVVFHDHDDAYAVGVTAPDGALAIYPFHFIYSCLEEHAQVTIQRAFAILKEGHRVPKLPPGGFENVMDHVR